MAQPAPGTAAIRVNAATVANHITPWMYGSCIEDVNHEIYGGLYAQRIFGESFEEPPTTSLPGWKTHGGSWRPGSDSLDVEPDAGAKLVRDLPEITDGSVQCDVRLADNREGNAGLILRVQNPRTGADTWTGYEISLNAHNRALILGRHRDNWTPLRSVEASVEPGKWHTLRVDLAGRNLRVFLDGSPQPLLDYTDDEGAILTGKVGLRTWNSHASFRRLSIQSKGQQTTDSLVYSGEEIPQVSGSWDPFHTGAAAAHYHINTRDPFNSSQSQEIGRGQGTGRVGISNGGLKRWGIALHKGKSYAGRVYLRQQGYPGRVTAALQSADGLRTYAQQSLPPVASSWTRRDFLLRSNSTDTNARFALWIDQPGTIGVDQVTLMETGDGLFHGLPDRNDISQALQDEGITFLRYGGSMVNAPEYRWKKMIGARDRRPQYHGTWYPYSTNGWGIEDFLQFCEAAHIQPAVAINIEETPQDAADLVDYLNGPTTTPWGRRRALNGHPRPYGLRYIEIGNEENDDEHYLERFQLLSNAMRPRDPNLQLVIAAWWRPELPIVRRLVQDLNGKASLWDLHVGGDGLMDGRQVEGLLTDMQKLLQEWTPGTTLKACIFEENGGLHNLQRALGHAHILNVTRRHGDFILMDCPANCLQPWRENDNGWDQGQLFFTPDKVWGMPPYYAQQMSSHSRLPLRVESQVTSPGNDLDLTATRSQDGHTLVLSVLNLGNSPHPTSINLEGFLVKGPHARAWTLTGSLDAVNTPDHPDAIRPQQAVLPVSPSRLDYTFPGYSYTVIQLKGSTRTH